MCIQTVCSHATLLHSYHTHNTHTRAHAHAHSLSLSLATFSRCNRGSLWIYSTEVFRIYSIHKRLFAVFMCFTFYLATSKLHSFARFRNLPKTSLMQMHTYAYIHCTHSTHIHTHTYIATHMQARVYIHVRIPDYHIRIAWHIDISLRELWLMTYNWNERTIATSSDAIHHCDTFNDRMKNTCPISADRSDCCHLPPSLILNKFVTSSSLLRYTCIFTRSFIFVSLFSHSLSLSLFLIHSLTFSRSNIIQYFTEQ